MSFVILHIFLLHLCLLICLLPSTKNSLQIPTLTSNMKIYKFLLLFALLVSVDGRAIPAAQRDQFGLDPQQRVCLYINCPAGEECVAVRGVPQCKLSATIAPCRVTPCEAVTPVCDQFGYGHLSECDMNLRSCNSSQQLTISPCPTAAPADCPVSVRSRLPSYSQPAPAQVSVWRDKADAGTLSYSDLRDSLLPSCEVTGDFKSSQCYSHIPNHLFCWCVKPETGEYRSGSFNDGLVDCSSYSEQNCSLRSDAGERLQMRHGESVRDTCSLHQCSHGVVTSSQDASCLLCPPQLLSDTKRLLFSQKGLLYQRATGKPPRLNSRRTLSWYFDRCDRNHGGELTRGDFINCHKNISKVSLACMDAVFQDCTGPRWDSILPIQWKRCFLRDISQAQPPHTPD